MPPLGYVPIPMAVQRLQLHLLRAELDGAPEDVLQKFRDYLLALTNEQQAAASPPPGLPGGDPGMEAMMGPMGGPGGLPPGVIPNAPNMGAPF